MRRVAVEDLETGDRLGRDVHPSGPGLPLLRAGVRISDSYCQALQRAGVMSVWVDDEASEGIEPLEALEESTKRRATTAIHAAFTRVTAAAPRGEGLPADVVGEMQAVAQLIIEDISRDVHSALALNDLASADAYTLSHSLAVTTMGLALGVRVMQQYGWVDAHGQRRFDDIEQRLAPLGVGLLLHDIGKLAIPQAILRKPGPLTSDERKVVREHPLLGVGILRRAAGISALSRAVVRSHHERWDGSGYPDGLVGDDIHHFARIAAVADVFDALTSTRCYRSATPSHDGYDFIVEGAGRDFDPEVTAVFGAMVAPFPPGTRVTLSDGMGALVKTVRPGEVKRPVVRVVTGPTGARVVPYEVDLAQSPGLWIVPDAVLVG